MRPLDPLLFLFGHRGAIERAAAYRWSLLVGALLVITAGIARNYDHIDFLTQAEWLIGPFAISLISSVIIYAVCFQAIKPRDSVPDGTPRFRMPYTQFLALFWLTAPCAWVYAIPVERWGDLLFATKWNLAFLGIVSVWRVLLMVRAVRVLTGARWSLVFFSILLPASLEAAIGSFFKGLSLISVMGGVRLPPHHIYLQKATATVATNAFSLTLASLVILCIILIVGKKGAARSFPPFKSGSPKSEFTAVAALIAWIAISLPTQAKVRNSEHLSKLIRSEEFKLGISFASELSREEFSPIHYLPPRPFESESRYLPELLTHVDDKTPAWLRAEWSENFALSIGNGYRYADPLTPAELLHLKTIPEIPASVRKHKTDILDRISAGFDYNAEESEKIRLAIEELAFE